MTPDEAGRAALRATVAVLTAFVLAACAGLPGSSSVQARRPIADAPTAPPANVEFYGPQADAAPVDLVKGFLRANGSVDEDFAVAREYLTTDASRSWAPSGRVAITQGERDFVVTEVSTGRVTLTVTQWAELDGGGHLRQFSTPTHRTVDIGLTQVNGQWRISRLPADFGPYLSMTDFRDRTYAPYTVYLAEKRTHTLVADQQWFPRTGVTAALARAVLRGVPEWMAQREGSMPDFNQVPGGTRLAVDAVPISADGVATVDLTESVRSADANSRTALWAAMMATLNQVPRVHRAAITVGGSRLGASNLPTNPVTPGDVGYNVPASVDNGVMVRVDQSLRWQIDGSTNGPARTPTRPTLPTMNRNWYLLSSDTDGSQIAGISGDRKTLGRWISGGAVYQVPAFGRQLTRPSFNGLDELWLAGLSLSRAGPDREVSSGATVWMMDTTNFVSTTRPQAISVPWLGDSQVLSLKSARDGQRIALVTRAPNGTTKLQLALVIRDANGQATALSNPIDVGQAVSDVVDVAWADDVTLAVITGTGDQPRQVIEVPLSGFVNPMGTVTGATEIVATGRGTGDLYVHTSEPAVQERIGGGWRKMSGVSEVIAPGA